MPIDQLINVLVTITLVELMLAIGLGMTFAERTVGVSRVVATGRFTGTPAVTATLAFAWFQTVLLALVPFGWGRRAPPIMLRRMET